jgi:hypothetical protein
MKTANKMGRAVSREIPAFRERPFWRSARFANSGCSRREKIFAAAVMIPTCGTENPYAVRKRSEKVYMMQAVIQ